MAGEYLLVMRDVSTGENPKRSVSRRTYLQLGAGASAVALAGCLGSDGDTLTYLCRGGIIEDAEREVLQDWEEENDITIQFESAAEDSAMLEQMASDPGGYDLVTLSPYGYALNEYGEDFADTELLADLDYGKVPNYEDNIQEEWRNSEFLQGHDKGMFYHISTQGLAYNTEKLPDGISSWEDIKDPALEDEVTLFDSAPTRFGQSCAAIGETVSDAVEDEELFAAVFEEVAEQHQNVYQYWETGNDFMTDLREERATVSSAWGGRVESLAEDGVPVDYAIPEEGCISWSVAFSLTEESDMHEEAYDLLNWIYEEETATRLVEQHYYPVPLKGDHEVMENRFESLDADDVVTFSWPHIFAAINEIEEQFEQIKRS